jgi:hypothetical protein
MVGIIGLVTVKRLLSNWMPFPKGVPKRVVFFNRLLRDRDIVPREPWVFRLPEKGQSEE